MLLSKSQPTGASHRAWIDDVRNQGLICYKCLHELHVLVTSDAGLREVLINKSYDYAKPALLVDALKDMVGLGLLLAEGEEHRVYYSR